MIYLDYTANAPVEPEVLNTFCEVERRCLGNANARHSAGRQAHAEMEKAILHAADVLNVEPGGLIFTSGASESNNTAIFGIAHASRHIGRHIITTPLEHASVSACLTSLQERGWEIDVLEVDRQGIIDLEHLNSLLRADTVLVTVCAVDSELGTIQPIDAVKAILTEKPDCRLHVDATQIIGKLPFRLQTADTVSLSGHKIGGINGSGLLWKRNEVGMEPLIHGGTSTTLYRSGSPAVALAASLAKALEIACSNQEQRLNRVHLLNALLRRRLSTMENVTIHSPGNALPHILNLGVKGIRGVDFRDALDAKGICVSVKSACSVENTPSRAVYAVTRNRRQALEAWRVSLSHLTTTEEIEAFISAYNEIVRGKVG